MISKARWLHEPDQDGLPLAPGGNDRSYFIEWRQGHHLVDLSDPKRMVEGRKVGKVGRESDGAFEKWLS